MPEPAGAVDLSVVVVAYNMARELPRTLRSLSAAMQRGISAQDYEIVVVDNGSADPVDEARCRGIADNLRVIRIEDAPPSPVRAINTALAQARGSLIGVCIDGARMASPGLLSLARAAAATCRSPVVGSLAFHLGPDVQMRSVAAGYDQAAEDRLLAGADWEADGYRLFGISSLAGSSQDGWFVIPAETNAVFMKRPQWTALGGYDERFVSPGGGLANLDLWARACALPEARVIMLLGEATFHQVHGGVATNARSSPWQGFHDEYSRIRGQAYRRPTPPAVYFGGLDRLPVAALRHSLDRLDARRHAA